MNIGPSFTRKIIYIALIALLLYPLFRLGQPASVSNGQRKAGGVLSQLRDEYEISQANLGEIDPTGSAIRLATVGMRGVATAILWSRAHHYKKVEDYDKLAATVKQITNLQPNFISVWEFQAHNLSYNISVEFDDYRHRYHWVKKGIEFLIEGTEANGKEPRLLQDVGWYTGQKIGRADEQLLYRDMFRQDRDFHEFLDQHVSVVSNPSVRGPDGKPDNWLVGRLWYVRAEALVDQGIPLRRISPLIFHKDAPMSLINHAEAIEKEGYFRDYARNAWAKSDEQWQKYGLRSIPTAAGFNVRLLDRGEAKARVEALTKQLDELAPGARDKIYQERYKTLTERERLAIETDPSTWPDMTLFKNAQQAYFKLEITHDEVADMAPPEHQRKARRIVDDLEREETYIRKIDQYEDIVQYDYWATRCRIEQTGEMARARELVYKGEKAYDEAKLDEARSLYEASWDLWAKILDENPELHQDITADEVQDHLKKYEALLRQLDERVPADFKLQWLLKRHDYAEEMPEGMPGLPGLNRITPEGDKQQDAPESKGGTPASSGETPADDSAPKPAPRANPNPPAADDSAPKPPTKQDDGGSDN